MHVLIATDGSPHAMRAAEWVARWGTTLSDLEITLVNVGHIPTALGVGPGGQRPTEFRILAEEMEHYGAEILDRTAQILSPHAAKVNSAYRAGDPAEEILNVARDEHADLIVVGRRGLGRLGGLVLGSVSERVLNGAACPVLVVR